MAWHMCPRCESKKVDELGKWMMSFIYFGIAGIFMFFGLLLPFLWLGVPVFFVISMLEVFFGKDRLRCKDCGHQWEEPKDIAQ